MRKYSYFAIYFACALVLLFLDFYTKAYAYSFFPLQPNGFREIPVFQNVLGVDFSLTLALNRGAAWGFFSKYQHLLLAFRLVVIVVMLFYLFFYPHERKKDFPLLLIVTGAFGNVVDYFIYGQVVDFFRFNLWGYPFPVFNIADTMITIGVFSFFLLSFLQKRSLEATK